MHVNMQRERVKEETRKVEVDERKKKRVAWKHSRIECI